MTLNRIFSQAFVFLIFTSFVSLSFAITIVITDQIHILTLSKSFNFGLMQEEHLNTFTSRQIKIEVHNNKLTYYEKTDDKFEQIEYGYINVLENDSTVMLIGIKEHRDDSAFFKVIRINKQFKTFNALNPVLMCLYTGAVETIFPKTK